MIRTLQSAQKLQAASVRFAARSGLARSAPKAVVVGSNSAYVVGSRHQATGDSLISSTVRAASTAASGGEALAALTEANPHVNVVRYEHKNRLWTLKHVQYYSEALAIGLVETGLQPGDVVLSWLPDHFSEQMVLQFACSKAGIILYTLDPALATKDPEIAKESLQKALEQSKANVLVSQEAGSDVNYVRLAEEVIPELRIFDQSCGQPFVTPRFPHLRFPIHTGFDQDEKEGWLPLKYFLVPSGNLDAYVPTPPSGTTPLAGEFVTDGRGVPTGLGKVLSNEEVVKSKAWQTYVSILNKEYHEVEGVGVIF